MPIILRLVGAGCVANGIKRKKSAKGRGAGSGAVSRGGSAPAELRASRADERGGRTVRLRGDGKAQRRENRSL